MFSYPEAQRQQPVAMESTGVYWRPIWNLLEGSFELLLVNARHVKMVPGRKTDVKDCEWIAQLLEHGLLRKLSEDPLRKGVSSAPATGLSSSGGGFHLGGRRVG